MIFQKTFVIIKNVFYPVDLFERKISMLSREITVVNVVGLHARPATFFIQKANSYKSSVWIGRDDRRVNAKSLLGILSLGIAKGMTVTLIADGADEALAVEGLVNLINDEISEY